MKWTDHIPKPLLSLIGLEMTPAVKAERRSKEVTSLENMLNKLGRLLGYKLALKSGSPIVNILERSKNLTKDRKWATWRQKESWE